MGGRARVARVMAWRVRGRAWMDVSGREDGRENRDVRGGRCC